MVQRIEEMVLALYADLLAIGLFALVDTLRFAPSSRRDVADLYTGEQ
jgi:hypothetical protein